MAQIHYCDSTCCEAEADVTVYVSEEGYKDSQRHYCGSCADVFMVGVQHGDFLPGEGGEVR